MLSAVNIINLTLQHLPVGNCKLEHVLFGFGSYSLYIHILTLFVFFKRLKHMEIEI